MYHFLELYVTLENATPENDANFYRHFPNKMNITSFQERVNPNVILYMTYEGKHWTESVIYLPIGVTLNNEDLQKLMSAKHSKHHSRCYHCTATSKQYTARSELAEYTNGQVLRRFWFADHCGKADCRTITMRGVKMASKAKTENYYYHCAACGIGALTMNKCGRCQMVRYCNAICQRADYKKHKKICPPVKKV